MMAGGALFLCLMQEKVLMNLSCVEYVEAEFHLYLFGSQLGCTPVSHQNRMNLDFATCTK